MSDEKAIVPVTPAQPKALTPYKPQPIVPVALVGATVALTWGLSKVIRLAMERSKQQRTITLPAHAYRRITVYQRSLTIYRS